MKTAKRIWICFWVLMCSVSGGAEVLEIVKTLPHTGYSEGITFHKGYLWHAIPKMLMKIDPKDGSTVASFRPATEYSESLVWFKGELWNVSYSDNGLYSGKLEGKKFAFSRKGSVPEKHAWGLTHNGKHLIVTGNYSKKLYFIDPKTGELVRTITTPIKDLEDLAWDGTGIWSSSFSAHRGQIFRIDPRDGAITQFFSLPDPEECPVIDGIAYHKNHLWITGKNCTKIYQAKKPRERQLARKAKK